MHCRTSANGSTNDSSAHHGRIPVSASISSLELVLDDRLQAAVGVVHQHDLASAEAALRDDQRADDVVGHHATGIADDVCITVRQTEHLEDVHAAVHARDDGQLPPGSQRQALVTELLDVLGVVGEQLVDVRLKGGGGHVGASIARSSTDGSV